MITILMVEDSWQDRKIYSETLLGLSQLELLYAETAEQALELLRENKIDLFFLDVELPGMDGFTLAEKIRNMTAYELTPILFITGYSKNPLDAFRQFHCYDFIVKPFSVDEFKEKVSELIEKLHRKQERNGTILRKLAAFETEWETAFLPIDEILFAQVRGRHCEIQTKKRILPLTGMTLQDVIEEVDDPFFVRCHKSFAVNVREIASIRKLNYRLYEISFDQSERKIDMSKFFHGSVEELVSKLEKVQEDKQVNENELV